MKIKEVPQDGKILEKSGEVRDVCYAVDENGDYKQVISVGWEPKNEAINYAWSIIEEEAEAIKKDVEAGKLSPLAFHIHKNVMTPEILASYTGFSKREIRRWCKPRHFSNLDRERLEKIASVLKIGVDQLVRVN
ncbi:MAG: hypothetical protein BGO30_06105 [Bacteroidetes bacterium 41-46]|jgi:hypothetical protein|nr:MAG: hypothetical protein BGO30_06105 [Bacteroidetes bacterium 41-46]